MPTNNVKHRMLVEAKRIANTEFKDFYYKDHYGVVKFISPIDQKKRLVNRILNEYPEFDSNDFRRMIKEIEVRNKERNIKDEQ